MIDTSSTSSTNLLYCGISLEQFRSFYEEHTVDGMTTDDVVSKIIKPLTKFSSYVTKIGSTRPASVFISHCWKTPFRHLYETIMDYFNVVDDSIVLWLDIFSLNQHKLPEDFRTWKSCFIPVIELIQNTLVVVTSLTDPFLIPFRRGWCLLEIYLSVKNDSIDQIPLNIAIHKKLRMDYFHFHNLIIVLETFCKLQYSHCTYRKDERRIRKFVLSELHTRSTLSDQSSQLGLISDNDSHVSIEGNIEAGMNVENNLVEVQNLLNFDYGESIVERRYSEINRKIYQVMSLCVNRLFNSKYQNSANLASFFAPRRNFVIHGEFSIDPEKRILFEQAKTAEFYFQIAQYENFTHIVNFHFLESLKESIPDLYVFHNKLMHHFSFCNLLGQSLNNIEYSIEYYEDLLNSRCLLSLYDERIILKLIDYLIAQNRIDNAEQFIIKCENSYIHEACSYIFYIQLGKVVRKLRQYSEVYAEKVRKLNEKICLILLREGDMDLFKQEMKLSFQREMNWLLPHELLNLIRFQSSCNWYPSIDEYAEELSEIDRACDQRFHDYFEFHRWKDYYVLKYYRYVAPYSTPSLYAYLILSSGKSKSHAIAVVVIILWTLNHEFAMMTEEPDYTYLHRPRTHGLYQTLGNFNTYLPILASEFAFWLSNNLCRRYLNITLQQYKEVITICLVFTLSWLFNRYSLTMVRKWLYISAMIQLPIDMMDIHRLYVSFASHILDVFYQRKTIEWFAWYRSTKIIVMFCIASSGLSYSEFHFYREFFWDKQMIYGIMFWAIGSSMKEDDNLVSSSIPYLSEPVIEHLPFVLNCFAGLISLLFLRKRFLLISQHFFPERRLYNWWNRKTMSERILLVTMLITCVGLCIMEFDFISIKKRLFSILLIVAVQLLSTRYLVHSSLTQGNVQHYKLILYTLIMANPNLLLFYLLILKAVSRFLICACFLVVYAICFVVYHVICFTKWFFTNGGELLKVKGKGNEVPFVPKDITEKAYTVIFAMFLIGYAFRQDAVGRERMRADLLPFFLLFLLLLFSMLYFVYHSLFDF